MRWSDAHVVFFLMAEVRTICVWMCLKYLWTRPSTNFLGVFIPAAEVSEAAAPTTFAGSIEAKRW